MYPFKSIALNTRRPSVGFTRRRVDLPTTVSAIPSIGQKRCCGWSISGNESGITIAAICCLWLIGCVSPEVTIPQTMHIEGYDESAKSVSQNPIQLIQESLDATRQIKAFTATFQRQERLGLLHELRPLETMAAEYRDDPFSVRFTWLDENSENRQCVYVTNKHGGNVLLLPRNAPLGQKPTIQKYPPAFAVLFAKSRNPITDFGPRRLMERTLDRIKKAEKKGKVTIKLRDPTEVGPDKEPCFHLELRYPESDPFPCKLQDLYISTRTKLPVATYLWLPGKIERCGETLDGMYTYSALRPLDSLTDAHFKIDADRRAAAGDSAEVLAGSP